MNNLDQNSYYKVFQKEDEKTKDLINSYRFQIDNQKQYKKWKPEISMQEQLKLKKKREDEYIQQFDDQKRPVFLVKKKQAFQGMSQKDLFDEQQTESYFKVTNNTNVIDNNEDEIQNEQQDTKRNTIVHQNLDEQGKFKTDNQIYKIEGTEYLPEGFLELDPLLLKDDYDFDNSEDEKLFKKEQAKLVALRRKQYTQKNYKKKRDVVILLLNEKIQAILNHLNDFYQQYKRKLNDLEREEVADKFNVSDQTLLDLEELFLHDNGYWDLQGAEEYMLKYAKIKGSFLYVPSEAKELYKKRREEIKKQLQRMQELKKKKNEEKQKQKKIITRNKSPKKQIKSTKNKPMSYFEKMQQRQKEIQNQKKSKSRNKSKKSIQKETTQSPSPKKASIKKVQVQKQNNNQQKKEKEEIEEYLKNDKKSIKEEQPKKVQFTTQDFQSFNPNTIKRVSIKQKDVYDNERNIIILQPQTIGSTVYYQEIHNLSIEGDNQATLITKILDDIIINKSDIPKELQTQGYSNQLFDDDQDPNDPLKKYLIVYNDKNQTVSVQTLRPKVETCQNVDLANQEIMMMNNNDVFIRGKEFQHFKERVHTLKPVQIFGQIYQQKVVQLVRGDVEQLKIITVEETGKIILKEELQQQQNTKYFYNKQETQLNIEDKNYNIFLILCNENGEQINQQKFTKILDEEQLEYYKQRQRFKRQSLIIKNSGINQNQRKISLPPFYHQNFLVLPSIEEKQNSLDVVLRNEEGLVITKGHCDIEKKSEFYSIEIVNKEIQKNGQIKLTFFLKDQNDNVINVVFLNDLNLIKEDEFQRNVKMINQKNDDLEAYSKDYKEFKSESIILGNIYIYQVLQIPFNMDKQANLITKTEYDDILDQQQIDNTKNDIQGVSTQLLETIKKNEFDDIYRIGLFDQNNNLLNVQELQKERIQFLSKRKIQIKDQFVTNQSDEAFTKKKEFKSIEFNGKIYNCQIQQILLNDSSKINIFSVKDKNENYYFAQQLENKQSLDNYGLQTQIEEDGLMLILRDHYNDIVLTYKINNNNKADLSDDINFNSHVSKVYIYYDEKNDTSKLIHYLRSVFVQKYNFCQVLEEKIFKKRNRQMIIKTYDHKKNIIDEKMIMKSESFGQNFQTRVNKILNTIDSENLITLETINEQKQIISTLNFKIPFKEGNYITVNDKHKEDEFKNEITVKNTMFENIVEIQLLPIFIGDGYFYHIIQKIKTFKNKDLQVYVLTFDKFDQLILKEEIYNLQGDNFKVSIIKEEKEDDNINVVVNIVNDNNDLIHVQKFKSQLSANLKNYYFTDFFDIYDRNKKKINQVAIQKRSKYTLRFVSLMPILIGNGFLLISVNEILHDKQKQAVVAVKNQKGQLVTFQKIEEKFIAQYYTYKIVQDKIEKDKRIITLEVINDNNEVVANFRLNPFQIQYDDFQNQQNLLEMVDEEGKQFFYLLRKNNDNVIQVIDHQRKSLQQDDQELKIDFIQRKSILQQIETQNLFSMKLDQEQLQAIQSRQSNQNNNDQDTQLQQLQEQLPLEDIQSEFSQDQHESQREDENFQSNQSQDNKNHHQEQRESYKVHGNFQITNEKKARKLSEKQIYDYQVKKQPQEDQYQPIHIGEQQNNYSQFFETNFKQSSFQNNMIHDLQIENLKNIYLKKSEYQEEQDTYNKPNLLQVKNFSFQQNSLNKLSEIQSEQDTRLKQMIDHIASINNEREKDKLIYQIENIMIIQQINFMNFVQDNYQKIEHIQMVQK